MKPVAMDGSDDTVSQSSDEPLVALQIYVPDLLLQKCMHFHRDELIWDVKHQIIASLPKELKESFNYGLFCPPVNGKAGKFLDEERPLVEYPFPEPGAFLELRYKRRIYKMMNVEEKQVKQMHTRANLRRLLENVGNCNVEKVSKLCARGMDPNFHCPETGETPLSVATGLSQPAKMILTLVNGGSLLDFRTKDGKTALHRAVEKDNFDSLKTLLDLGSSPNYKDSRGLTSLYYSVLYGCDPRLTELLLHDHALIGATDPQGWQEVHQACKHGLVQHLEHLLFYGADMNAHNASGNTPLHVCAVNDQESCARVLLFRGADKGALNYANQNPYQVAVIAGNLNLAEIIQNHRLEDVAHHGQKPVPYREVPKYNPRRRASSMAPSVMNRAQSDPHLEALGIACSPLSPCPSSQYPFSSSVSTISEASSTGSSSSATTQMGSETEDTASGVTDKSLLSDSSGVCTSHSGTSYEDSGSELLPERGSLGPLRPGAICVCLEDYQVALPGHLNLVHGDLLEVLGLTENGLYQGKTREGEEGLFPAQVVQEVKLRSDLSPNGEQQPPSRNTSSRVEGRREMSTRRVSTVPRRWRLLESHYGEPRTVILHKGKKGFGFVLRGAKGAFLEPHVSFQALIQETLITATSPLMERQPSEYWPSLQYLDDVDKGGVADMAGLKKGDFLLEINGQDVSQASHEHVVTIIRHSGDLVAMTVVTVQPPNGGQTQDQRPLVPRRQCATLPRKLSTKKAPVPPKRDPKTTLSVGRARARSMVAGLAEIEVLDRSLNEYDSEGRSTKSSSIESIPNKQSATTTPSEASSSTHNTNNSGSPALAQKIASIRARPSSRRITATELEDFFSRQKSEGVAGGTLPAHLARGPKVYGSMAALKRGVKGSVSRQIGSSASDARLHKEFHSSPDLNGLDANQVLCNGQMEPATTGMGEPLSKRRSHSQEDLQGLMMSRHQHSWGCPPHAYTRTGMDYKDAWKSVEEIYERVKAQDEEERRETDSGIYAETLPLTTKSSSNSSGSTSATLPMRAPPPSHPPPPPPVGQVVKVDVSRAMGEYANVVRQEKTTVMSSFRPGDSAKLYESPDAVMTGSIGIKKEAKRSTSGPRSQSLPPRIATGRPPYRAPTSEAESSGDSLYSAFKVLHRPNREQAESLSSERSATLKSVKGKSARPYSPKFCPEVDSEVESPSHPHPQSHHPHHHYHPSGSIRNQHPGHEPFIPEPDYDSSTSEEELADKGTLVTFGKAEEIPMEGGQEVGSAGSPHTEAKKAIQEAKQRLRVSEADIVAKSAKERARKIISPPAVLDDTAINISSTSDTLLVNGESKGKEELSPVVEVISTSVRENICVFERKSEISLPPQPPPQPLRNVQPLPPQQQQQQSQQQIQQQQQTRSGESQAAALRRLNEGIKTALSGTLTRLNQERCRAQMKTSKSCPKDFVGEDNSSSGVSSDIETASADDQSPFGGMHSSCTLPHQLLNRHQQHYMMQQQQQQQQGRVGIVRKGSLPDAGALVALKDRLGNQSQPGTERRVRHVTPGANTSEIAVRRPGRSRARSHEDDADETDMEEDEEVRRVPPTGGGAVRVQVDSLGLAAVNEVDVMTELLPPPPEFAIPGAADGQGHHGRPPHVQEAFAPPPPQFSDESLMMMMRRSGVQRVQMHTTRMRQVAGAQQQQQHQQHRYHPDYASRSATLQHPHKQHQSAQHLQQQQLYGTLRESKQAQSMHRPVAAEVVRAAEAARAAEMARATEMARLAEAARQAATTAPKQQHKEFRVKCLHEWNCRDVCDWLDSLFLSEYKSRFTEAGITGAKLSNMDNNDLMGLGVKQVGHRLNMERSIKRYLK